MKKVIKLLDDHPNVKEVVRAWFTNKLVKTLDDSMPKEFQEFVKAQQVTNEKLAVMVKEGPRGLFDVFDDNEISKLFPKLLGVGFDNVTWCFEDKFIEIGNIFKN